jgi:hypothetical protein
MMISNFVQCTESVHQRAKASGSLAQIPNEGPDSVDASISANPPEADPKFVFFADPDYIS